MKFNINFNNYKIFYEVAKEKSFTKASKKLYLSQPAISTIIKNLETELGILLFKRKHNGVSLTKKGFILYNSLTKAFFQIEEAEISISKTKLNPKHVFIGTTRDIGDYYLSQVINKFIQKYPDIYIDLCIDTSSVLLRKLESGIIDVMIDIYPIIANSPIDVLPVQENPLCFICNKNIFQQLAKTNCNIQSIFNYKIVFANEYRDILNKISKKSRCHYESLFEIPNSKLMMDILLNNDCIGLISEKMVDHNLMNLKLFKIKTNIDLEKIKIVAVKLKESENVNVKLFLTFINAIYTPH